MEIERERENEAKDIKMNVEWSWSVPCRRLLLIRACGRINLFLSLCAVFVLLTRRRRRKKKSTKNHFNSDGTHNWYTTEPQSNFRLRFRYVILIHSHFGIELMDTKNIPHQIKISCDFHFCIWENRAEKKRMKVIITDQWHNSGHPQWSLNSIWFHISMIKIIPRYVVVRTSHSMQISEYFWIWKKKKKNNNEPGLFSHMKTVPFFLRRLNCHEYECK